MVNTRDAVAATRIRDLITEPQSDAWMSILMARSACFSGWIQHHLAPLAGTAINTLETLFKLADSLWMRGLAVIR